VPAWASVKLLLSSNQRSYSSNCAKFKPARRKLPAHCSVKLGGGEGSEEKITVATNANMMTLVRSPHTEYAKHDSYTMRSIMLQQNLFR
jgi:hypothetical protein